MNVIFLSPGFPPTASSFCAALAKEGVRVLGIGDQELSAQQHAACHLTEYVLQPRMAEYQPLHDTVEALQHKYGRIDRIDSNGEHWLVAEARLRDDFGVPGLDSRTLQRQLSKLAMAEIFANANIPYPPTIASKDGTEVRAFAKRYGYPLVFKPEVGSGAVDTYTVNSDGELEAVLERQPESHVLQPFVAGQLITFDGLAGRDGEIPFFTAHVYDEGIMQVRRGELDGHYYSLRELPPGLADLGRRAVAAFDVRERFFHIEFFARPDGSFMALEMNLRPPGGFTTDMMNAACGVDVYALWATTLAGYDTRSFHFERRFHTAHAGRRAERQYRYSARELAERLGSTLLVERAVPPAFAATMGDVAYLLRHDDLGELKRAIALVHQQ